MKFTAPLIRTVLFHCAVVVKIYVYYSQQNCITHNEHLRTPVQIPDILC